MHRQCIVCGHDLAHAPSRWRVCSELCRIECRRRKQNAKARRRYQRSERHRLKVSERSARYRRLNHPPVGQRPCVICAEEFIPPQKRSHTCFSCQNKIAEDRRHRREIRENENRKLIKKHPPLCVICGLLIPVFRCMSKVCSLKCKHEYDLLYRQTRYQMLRQKLLADVHDQYVKERAADLALQEIFGAITPPKFMFSLRLPSFLGPKRRRVSAGLINLAERLRKQESNHRSYVRRKAAFLALRDMIR